MKTLIAVLGFMTLAYFNPTAAEVKYEKPQVGVETQVKKKIDEI